MDYRNDDDFTEFLVQPEPQRVERQRHGKSDEAAELRRTDPERAPRSSKKPMSDTPFIALSAVFALVFVICTVFSIKNIVSQKSPESPVVDPGMTEVVLDGEVPALDLVGNVQVNTGEVEYLKDMLDEYKSLYAFNSDTVGWLRVPNTSIDTVIVQSETDDGRTAKYKYLKNDFYGQFTKYGNVFLDYRCNKFNLSKNTIFYGHTTSTKEQVFYDLVKYENMEFFKQNPIIEYSTLYNHYKWKVFGVFVTSVNAADDGGYIFNYIFPGMSDSSFEGYLKEVNERVLYNTGVDMVSTDKILTLSTCSYNYNVNGTEITSRLVVVARMLRNGESEAIDSTLVTDHPDYRRPQRWYKLTGKTNPYQSSTWTPSAE